MPTFSNVVLMLNPLNNRMWGPFRQVACERERDVRSNVVGIEYLIPAIRDLGRRELGKFGGNFCFHEIEDDVDSVAPFTRHTLRFPRICGYYRFKMEATVYQRGSGNYSVELLF
ncbi:hypothetical protein TWF718_002054 [Orbilia javanica]|uniref:Uncharacterized protein n=1 Tax=Orbilia javanica TaxID=47235 RepID=A0AAN8N624_9PEZI